MPESDTRLAQEKEEESEEESEILEESPCGRWQKRREQVGGPGAAPGCGRCCGIRRRAVRERPRGVQGEGRRGRCGERAVGSGARRAPLRCAPRGWLRCGPSRCAALRVPSRWQRGIRG